MKFRWPGFFICAAASLTLLACGLIMPAHLRGLEAGVVRVAGRNSPGLGGTVYHISPDPYKFQDAVLIGADEGYYGECNFQIDLSTPNYLRLDRNLLKGLFGKFNPSRGDLVFSRAGELLGIMVNNLYCLSLHDFATAATIPFNEDLRSRHTGETLSELYGYIFQLPLRLK